MEGKILQAFIEDQRVSKQKIADDLGMSRRNLYQLFESKTLTEETKKKFEDYFKEKIFKGQSVNKIVNAARDGNVNILRDYLAEYLDHLKKHNTELENENAEIKITRSQFDILLKGLQLIMRQNSLVLRWLLSQEKRPHGKTQENAGEIKTLLAEKGNIDKLLSEILN